VRSIAWQSVLMVGALSVITALVGVFGARQLMVHVVGAKGKVAEIGTSYLRVLMGGGFTIFFLLHLTSIQRALGSSKTPVSMLITSNSANLLLAALLVYGPGPAPPLFSWAPPIARALGIPRLELLGAAWATLIARALVLLPIVIIMVRRFGLFRPPSITLPHIGIFRSIWGIGWPSSVQLVVRILAMLVTHSLVARAYTTAEDQSASTAFGIVFRLETMALFIGLGWGSAAQTFVGQNLGAANPQRAKLSGYYAALFNSVMMAALALVYRLYAERVIGFFDHRPEVLEVGVRYVRLVGWSYVCLGIGIVLGSAIQGAGATKLTLRLDTLVVFAFQLPTSLIAVMGLGMGYERLCQIVALTYFAFAVVYILNYRRGTFLKTQLA
jgi:putative MATE family efflux protein